MTFPLATLAATVTSAGITAPPYSDILTSLQTSFAAIYGQDVYLGSDTQDGQLLAIFAKAISDGNDSAIAAYNQFSPSTAQGAGLSSIVKINGIARLVASNSSADLLIGGSVGTVILNGIAGDANGNSWALPASVTIPSAGSIIATSTCVTPGSISAVANSINVINTPQLGWATVTNQSDASIGAPVESDAQLRLRQSQSVALPALSPLEATLAAVKSITGVSEAVIYENDTNTTDANGLPPHSIALVVAGGDATAIATAISNKKTPGCYTYGTTSIFVTDSAGVTHQIRFFVPTNVPIQASVTIKALTGYTAATGVLIQQAIAAYVNALPIGQAVYIARLYIPAQLSGGAGFSQYELQQLLICVKPGTPAALDVAIPFNSQATMLASDVALTVM